MGLVFVEISALLDWERVAALPLTGRICVDVTCPGDDVIASPCRREEKEAAQFSPLTLCLCVCVCVCWSADCAVYFLSLCFFCAGLFVEFVRRRVA